MQIRDCVCGYVEILDVFEEQALGRRRIYVENVHVAMRKVVQRVLGARGVPARHHVSDVVTNSAKGACVWKRRFWEKTNAVGA